MNLQISFPFERELREVSFDPSLVLLLAGVLVALIIGSLAGFILSLTVKGEAGRATVANLNARLRAWWVMIAVFGIAVATGGIGSLLLFGLISFLALREFVTLAPTRAADHQALFWSFFVLLPLQYYLIWLGWYGLFAILIPVYGFIFIAVRSVLAGDIEHFMARTSTVNWALMVCVYCVSHAPALLMLEIPGFQGQNANLLFFLVLVVQLSDVLQYVWGKLLGRHKVAPVVSPNKTWEGLIGGILSATAVGAAVWWATPFTPRQAAGMAFLICVMGFAGGLVMAAIKRDRGVKDFGTLIEGHGGILDRIDSLCFAAPIFFHVTRFFFDVSGQPIP
jgi:phosphatidate cytidylyltransferase